MGKKLYVKDETGIKFTSQRKPGDIRIPNYVYDMWLPLLGAETLGVYAVYCRLEMEGAVKKMTMDTLAGACRIGKVKLSKINIKLEQCGFIKVIKPTGQARLMHWTSEVVIFDPPQTIPQELIDSLAPERGYEVLTPWLVKEDSELTEVLDGTSVGAGQNPDEVPDGTPNIESLDLNPLDVEEGGDASRSPPPPAIPLLPESLDPLAGLGLGTDGHQRAVDEASGGNGIDPITEIIKHLRWLCVGRGASMPKGTELGGYRKAARQLLEEKINTKDWRGVCQAIDDWSENPPEADIWQRERTKRPQVALDCIAAHYWDRQNGGPHGLQHAQSPTSQSQRTGPDAEQITAALKARARPDRGPP